MNRQIRQSRISNRGKRIVRAFGPLAPKHFINLANNNDRPHTISEETEKNMLRIENLRLKEATYNKLHETIAILKEEAHYWYQSYQGLLTTLLQSGIIISSNEIQRAARPASRQVFLPPINRRSTTALPRLNGRPRQ